MYKFRLKDGLWLNKRKQNVCIYWWFLLLYQEVVSYLMYETGDCCVLVIKLSSLSNYALLCRTLDQKELGVVLHLLLSVMASEWATLPNYILDSVLERLVKLSDYTALVLFVCNGTMWQWVYKANVKLWWIAKFFFFFFFFFFNRSWRSFNKCLVIPTSWLCLNSYWQIMNYKVTNLYV